jgi:hypothetical protein
MCTSWASSKILAVSYPSIHPVKTLREYEVCGHIYTVLGKICIAHHITTNLSNPTLMNSSRPANWLNVSWQRPGGRGQFAYKQGIWRLAL